MTPLVILRQRRLTDVACGGSAASNSPNVAMVSLISDHASRLQWIFLHPLHMRRKRPSAGVQAVVGMAGRSSVCDVRQRCSTSSSSPQSDVHTHITPQLRRVAIEPQIIHGAHAASYLAYQHGVQVARFCVADEVSQQAGQDGSAHQSGGSLVGHGASAPLVVDVDIAIFSVDPVDCIGGVPR